MTLKFVLRSTEIGGFSPQVLHMALRDRSDKFPDIAQVEERQPYYQGTVIAKRCQRAVVSIIEC